MPNRSDVYLARAATALQVLLLLGLVVLIVVQRDRIRFAAAWPWITVGFLLPLAIQVLVCRFLRSPIISVAAILASLIILLLLGWDVVALGYLPMSLVSSLPITVLLLVIGTLTFAIHRAISGSANARNGSDPAAGPGA